MLAAICELVQKGLSIRHAAEKLHVHHSTVGQWRKDLPEFDAAISAAEAAFIEDQISNIRAAATKNWQASAWLLERKWPEFFSQPQVQLNMPAQAEFKELSVVLAELEKSPEARRLLPPEIWEHLPSQSPVIDAQAESSSAG